MRQIPVILIRLEIYDEQELQVDWEFVANKAINCYLIFTFLLLVKATNICTIYNMKNIFIFGL